MSRKNTDPFEPKSSRPTAENSHYLIRGVNYPRVTTILGEALGHGLLLWYGKEAALRCADLAYIGLGEEPLDTDVIEFRTKRAPHVNPNPGPERALREITNWRDHMREAERFRDFRGHIGSTVHHAAYEFILGSRVSGTDEIDWLTALAKKTSEYSEEALARFSALGKNIFQDVAFEARAYFHAVKRFIETVDPEWQMNGLETCVYSESEEYAGTADLVMKISNEKWTAAGYEPLPAPEMTFLGDWKSSKSVSQSFLYQLAAYANADYVYLFPDESQHPVPPVDGVMVLHVTPKSELKVQPHYWFDTGDRTPIADAFEAFCGLNAYYRHLTNYPKATRSKFAKTPKPEPAKVGSRPCPF